MKRPVLSSWIDVALELQEENRAWRDTCNALLFWILAHHQWCQLAHELIDERFGTAAQEAA